MSVVNVKLSGVSVDAVDVDQATDRDAVHAVGEAGKREAEGVAVDARVDAGGVDARRSGKSLGLTEVSRMLSLTDDRHGRRAGS